MGGSFAEWVNQAEKNAPHEANFLKLNCEKVKETFGWKPKLHVDEAVAWTVEWTKAWLAGADTAEVMDLQIARFFE